jgi:uncharacterized protein (TIGR02271 family)
VSTYSSSPIAFAVFRKDSDAKRAIDALRDAGFDRDQIGLAWREGGSTNVNYLNDLVNLGVPQEQAAYYDNEFKAGHPVVSVRTDGRDQEVQTILRQYNAYDFTNRDAQTTDYAQTNTADYARTSTAADYAQTTGRDTAADTDTYASRYGDVEHRSIPLREERLVANKETVQTGEARLHKDVIAEEKTIDVPVTREEVVVERHAGSGQVSDAPIGQDETIRVPVREEQVNVNKTTVETGEVALGKRTVQENQRVTDTVRREEAHLETDGNPTVRTNDDLENK